MCKVCGIAACVLLVTFAAANAAPTDPSTIAGLVARFDSRLVNGVGQPSPADGEFVGTWTNLGSVAVNAAAKDGNRPAFVAAATYANTGAPIPVVRFSVGDETAANIDWMSSGASPYSGDILDHTVLVVFVPNNEETLLNPNQFGWVAAGSNSGLLTYYGTTGRYKNSTEADGPGIVKGQLNFMAGRFLDAADENALWVNDNAKVLKSTTTTTHRPYSFLGSRIAGQESLNGDIAEVLVYNSALTDDQVAGLHEYLYNKWFVPEPATMALLAFGAVGLLRRRR